MKVESVFNEKITLSNTKLAYVVVDKSKNDCFGRKAQVNETKIKEAIV